MSNNPIVYEVAPGEFLTEGDLSAILQRVKNTYNPIENDQSAPWFGETLEQQYNFLIRAFASEAKDLPPADVILENARQGVLRDLAARGPYLTHDPRVKGPKHEQERIKRALLEERIVYNLHMRTLEYELEHKRQREWLLGLKKLELYPALAVRAAWNTVQAIRSGK